MFRIAKDGGVEARISGNFYLWSEISDWHQTEVKSKNEKQEIPFLLTHKKTYASYHVKLSQGRNLVMIVNLIVYHAIWLCITLIFLRIFRSLKNGSYFQRQNITRLQLIAAVIFVAPILKQIYNLQFFAFSQENITITDYNLWMRKDIFFLPAWINSEMVFGFFGMLLVLAITEVFRKGIELKTENDLTV
ncbi:MAG: DUF2975 domain-containing protein [Bacteroidetes bacterium]|nr:DUF2975 domain-containing protein [Bacteroidota bacterium]